MNSYLIPVLQGVAAWVCLFTFAQITFLPVTASCEASFVRQTVNDPAWAKDFWDDVAKEVEKKNDTRTAKAD